MLAAPSRYSPFVAIFHDLDVLDARLFRDGKIDGNPKPQP